MSHISSKEVGLAAILSPKNTTNSNTKASGGGEFATFLSDTSATQKGELAKLSKEELAELNQQIQNITNPPATVKEHFDEDETLSSFMQVLALLEIMQHDTKDIKLSNFKELFTKAKISVNELNELSNAKDVKELIKVANKLELNIKKIDFKVLDEKELSKAFPILKERNFFKNLDLKPELSKLATKASPKEELIKPTPPLSEVLKQISTLKDENTKPKEEDLHLKSKDENFKEVKVEVKESLKPSLKEEVKEELSLKDISTKEVNEVLKKEEVKIPANELKILLKPSEAQSTKSEEKLVKVEVDTQPKKEQTSEIKQEKSPLELSVNEVKKKSKVEKETKVNKEILSTLEEKPKAKEASLKPTHFEESKIELNPVKENKELNKFLSNFINHEPKKQGFVKNDEKEVKAKWKQDPLKELLGMNEKKEVQKTELKSVIEEEVPLESSVKDTSTRGNMSTFTFKNDLNQPKQIPVKETLNHFASDLYEAAKEQKGPVNKLSINLNPHNLGEVEVTLTQRGNNLHVSFASNSNTMQIFLANQAEFKASLVNMGFGELQMSFSEKKEGQNAYENEEAKKKAVNEEESDESVLELEIAKYF